MVDREKKRITANKWYYANKENPNYLAGRERYRKSPNCAWQDLKKGARRRGIKFELIYDNFCIWFTSTPRLCVYCDIPQEYLKICYPDKPQNRLSIDRIDNGFYRDQNLCFACDSCNIMKGNILSPIEMREIAQKYIKPKWQLKLLSKDALSIV